MIQIFLSYKREYQKFAVGLRDNIKNWGYNTWIDVENIPKGSFWPDEIDKGLSESDVIIGVMTPEAIESRNVKNEWDAAIEYRKPLLLLRLISTRVPVQYISINFIDFTQDEQAGIQQLKKTLETIAANPHAFMAEISHPVPKPVVVSVSQKTEKERMLEKVRQIWINGVLEKIASNNTLIVLGIEGHPQTLLHHSVYGDYKLPSEKSIVELFKNLNGELLILGKAGCGKSFTLLQLARGLLDQSQKDEKKPIPVIFNLCSWAQKQEPIENWLIHELQVLYQVPKQTGSRWIKDGELTLLLDGLDEVGEDQRDQCVVAINTFRSEYSFVEIALCSRTDDYEKLSTRLELEGAIVIQPLSIEQIQLYLAQENLSGLRAVYEHDSVLQTMAESPFLLNTMGFAYAGKSEQALSTFNNEIARRNHLFGEYIKKRFDQVEDASYTQKDARHYLKWLARKMVENERTIFHIEELQPAWLETHSRKHQYKIISLVITGVLIELTGALAGGLACALLIGLFINPLLAFIFGFLLASIVWFIRGKRVWRDEIEPIELLSWSWQAAQQSLRKSLFIILGVGIIVAIAAGIVTTAIGGTTLGLIGIVFGGLAGGLAVGLGDLLNAGFVPAELTVKVQPNEAVWRSARNVFRIVPAYAITGTLVGIIIGAGVGSIAFGIAYGFQNLPTGLFYGLAYGGSVGLTVGLLGGLGFGILTKGGQVVIKHMVVRYLLNKTNNIPENYAHFLDYMTELIVLRKVGGGYEFIHRLMREYLSEIGLVSSLTLKIDKDV